MPEFICTQCKKDDPGTKCKVFVSYDGYGEYPTGCLYKSMRELGYTGEWVPYLRQRKQQKGA